jgi:hypothetical protein
MNGIMARSTKNCATYDDVDHGIACRTDNTGSSERVPYFVLVNSAKFIILERANGRNVIFF